MIFSMSAGCSNIVEKRTSEGGTQPELAITLENLPRQAFSTPLGEFKVIKTVGHGSYGRVKLVISSITGEKLAVKIVKRTPTKESSINSTFGRKTQKRNLTGKETKAQAQAQANAKNNAKRTATLRDRILREANLCKLLRHPNIVALRDFRISFTHYYLFFDYIDGCQLAERIGPKGCPENQAALLFAQIADAIAYCHRYSIVHRDIKIENILVDKNDHIKLIDFGLANFYDPTSQLKTSCGTIPYTSPEILRGAKYIGPEVDIWSLGVVLFTMLTGTLPFGDPRYRENYFKILRSEVRYPHTMSPESRDLISFCLHPDPLERFTIAQVQTHVMLAAAYEELDREANRVPLRTSAIALSTQIDEGIISEMAACLLAPRETILEQLKSEMSQGWKRPQTTEDDGKILCRSCPLVSVYHLIATHSERQIKDKFSTPSVSEFPLPPDGAQIKELLLQNAPKNKYKLRWRRKRVTVKSRARRRVGLAVSPITTCLATCNYENDASLQTISTCLNNKQQKNISTVNLNLDAKDVKFNSLQARKLTLIESMNNKGRILVGRGDLGRVHALLITTLERLEIAHKRVMDFTKTAYVGQYSPSLSQNEPAFLDSLSCSFIIEIVELSAFTPRLHTAKLPPLYQSPFTRSQLILNQDPTSLYKSRSASGLYCLVLTHISGSLEKIPTLTLLIHHGMTSPAYVKQELLPVTTNSRPLIALPCN